jgi:hypothetical protein
VATLAERPLRLVGVAPEDLARRAIPPKNSTSRLTAAELTSWLLAERLAIVDEDGLLWPTALGIEIASGLSGSGGEALRW